MESTQFKVSFFFFDDDDSLLSLLPGGLAGWSVVTDPYALWSECEGPLTKREMTADGTRRDLTARV